MTSSPSLYAQLLKELQKLEKSIVAERLKTLPTQPVLRTWFEELHRLAEVGGRFEDFCTMTIRRDTVQLLLRCLYVRVLEDLEVLEPPRLRGERSYHYFHALAPALGRRAWLEWVFTDLSYDFPTLFPGPRYADELGHLQALPLPSEDLCEEIWHLWHRSDATQTPLLEPLFRWQRDGFDSRFLGDLYQDLDGEVRKHFALLQTPHFVEQWILKHTLMPALEHFPLEDRPPDALPFRLLDPTCGSGHFLVGAFHHLAELWEQKGKSPWEAAHLALDSVWGCDINPHAVDIARFRLLLEVISRTGERDLERLTALPLHLACLDSLIPWEGIPVGGQAELFASRDRLSHYASHEERQRNAAFLSGGFEVVVGNPPYITPKDVRKRDDYRIFWPDACHRKYALSAPFAERFFSLGKEGAFVGQITANSFMKREFGKPLIEKVLARLDLTGVIDTSGAYIPGHGTPTVILFGRKQPPQQDRLWAILGKRGEPKRPDKAEDGLVWQALSTAALPPESAAGIVNDDSPFITVARLERRDMAKHPWSLGGGDTGEVLEAIQRGHETLGNLGIVGGVFGMTNADETFLACVDHFRRQQVPDSLIRQMVVGDSIRDYNIQTDTFSIYPYINGGIIDIGTEPSLMHYLANYKQHLGTRATFGGGTYFSEGRKWWAWHQIRHDRAEPPTITFAFVATHNHFVLDRGGKVFKQSAPILKLKPDASLDDHLDLLGLLNSSTLGFWMRQVFYPKGGDKKGDGARSSAEDWSDRLEYDSTKLQRAPLVTGEKAERIALARALDEAAQERARCLPAQVLSGGGWSAETLEARLAGARQQYEALTGRLVALQEELDWLTYRAYGLLDGHRVLTPEEVEPLMPGHRPFELLLARRDEEAEPDEKTAWFSRHGHARSLEVPVEYPPATQALLQERIGLIEGSSTLQLLEQPAFKRRWQRPELLVETRNAAEQWLLDRLEALFAPAREGQPAGPLSKPQPYRLEAIVAALRRDPRVGAVAGVLEGSANLDLEGLVERLVQKEALPDNPYRLYTPSGLEKWRQWQKTWELQSLEDKGRPLVDPDTQQTLREIPLPPRFERPDFQKAEYFSLRGKLNVPRERFIAFTELRQPHFGWNGWRDVARAQAQAEAFARVETDPEQPLPPPTSTDPRRCGATLGLWESLPDLARWGDADAHEELQALAQEVCHQPRCPCPVVEAWQRWKSTGVLPSSEARETEGQTVPAVSFDEQSAIYKALLLFGQKGARLAELQGRVSLKPGRLEQVLEELRAEGLVLEEGRGKLRRIVWKK